MVSCFSRTISVLALVLVLLSCNKNVEDSSELWKNAQKPVKIVAVSKKPPSFFHNGCPELWNKNIWGK